MAKWRGSMNSTWRSSTNPDARSPWRRSAGGRALRAQGGQEALWLLDAEEQRRPTARRQVDDPAAVGQQGKHGRLARTVKAPRRIARQADAVAAYPELGLR